MLLFWGSLYCQEKFIFFLRMILKQENSGLLKWLIELSILWGLRLSEKLLSGFYHSIFQLNEPLFFPCHIASEEDVVSPPKGDESLGFLAV